MQLPKEIIREQLWKENVQEQLLEATTATVQSDHPIASDTINSTLLTALLSSNTSYHRTIILQQFWKDNILLQQLKEDECHRDQESII